ncbi:MAG: cation:proton antiporter [Catenulispora sp.]|nr:cation:proton antiporter [Catenulispora sp.]
MPIPVIGSHQLLLFLCQLGVLLAAALCFGRVCVRLGAPALVGELCAGVVLGPSLLGWAAPGLSRWLLPREASQFHLLDAAGELGVLLLVGISGAHLDLKVVRRHGRTAVLYGAAGLVVPLLAGIAVGFAAPAALAGPKASDTTVFALFIGIALAASAIPVIAKTLLEMGLMHRDVGQLIMAAAALDDVAAWLGLSIVSAVATTGWHGGAAARDLAWLVGIVVAAGLLRPVARRVLRLAAGTGDPNATLAAVTVMVFAGSAATQALGFEAILGAFAVGLVIGSCPEFDPVCLAPLQTVTMAVLAPLFFATAGLRMDLTGLRQPAVLGAGALIVAVAVAAKLTGASLGAWLSRRPRYEALAVGAGLNCRGVVEVVIAMVGLRTGVLSTPGYTVIVLVAIVTSLMAPPMLRLAVRRLPLSAQEEAREQRWSTTVLSPDPAIRSG